MDFQNTCVLMCEYVKVNLTLVFSCFCRVRVTRVTSNKNKNKRWKQKRTNENLSAQFCFYKPGDSDREHLKKIKVEVVIS